MQTKMETQSGLDKTAWGDGPWQDEPDRAEWRDEATGLPCLALRHEWYGSWCGYVAIPADHPWNDAEDLYDVETHGEITYGPAPCQPENEGEKLPWLRVCHTPQPGESDDVRWVGFDCNHTGYHDPDLSPGREYSRTGTYRDLPYVQTQCALLAKQAKEATHVSG